MASEFTVVFSDEAAAAGELRAAASIRAASKGIRDNLSESSRPERVFNRIRSFFKGNGTSGGRSIINRFRSIIRRDRWSDHEDMDSIEYQMASLRNRERGLNYRELNSGEPIVKIMHGAFLRMGDVSSDPQRYNIAEVYIANVLKERVNETLRFQSSLHEDFKNSVGLYPGRSQDFKTMEEEYNQAKRLFLGRIIKSESNFRNIDYLLKLKIKEFSPEEMNYIENNIE